MLRDLLNRTRINLNLQLRYIYALIDPRDNEARYIGVTKDVYSRLDRHVKNASKVDDRKGRWISELEKLGLSPELEILETIKGGPDVVDEIALERERFWTNEFLKSGASLLNVHNVPHTKPQRQTQSRQHNDVQNIAPMTPFGEARARTGLTMIQLCTEANVSEHIIRSIERDQPVSAPLAARACRVLSHYLDQPVTYQSLGIKVLESRRHKR